MKCAVYVRVSTEEQAKEGYSLATQTDKIVEYIKNKGWTYSEVYCDDGYRIIITAGGGADMIYELPKEEFKVHNFMRLSLHRDASIDARIEKLA